MRTIRAPRLGFLGLASLGEGLFSFGEALLLVEEKGEEASDAKGGLSGDGSSAAAGASNGASAATVEGEGMRDDFFSPSPSPDFSATISISLSLSVLRDVKGWP